MDNVLLLISLAGLLYALFLIVFGKGRRARGVRFLVGSFVLFIVAAVIGVDKNQREATTAGFSDYAEYQEALKSGKPLAEYKAQLESQKANAGGFRSVEEYKTAAAYGFRTSKDWQAHNLEEEFFAIPEAERRFVEIVERYTREFRSAGNELAAGGTRNARKAAMCDSMKSLTVRDWVGKIYKLSSNSEGRGVLEIEIASDIYLTTWNNSFSDLQFNTLIDPQSEMFRALSKLKDGNRIKFSGRFFQGDEDCLRESSLSLRGSMAEPEFIFRFSEVHVPELPSEKN